VYDLAELTGLHRPSRDSELFLPVGVHDRLPGMRMSFVGVLFFLFMLMLMFVLMA
jgi:hypothetical protein